MSDLAVFLNRVSSLISFVIGWAVGLSVGFAALLPCEPFSVGLPSEDDQKRSKHVRVE
jgi:hypothetical protein